MDEQSEIELLSNSSRHDQVLKDSMPLPVITLRNSHQNILWLSAPLKVTFLRVTSPTNLLWLGIFGNVTISTPSMTSSYQ
jgi:hypothetical protein